MFRRMLVGSCCLVLLAALGYAQNPAPDRAAKWEKEIAGIEKRLKATPPPADPIVFGGSSSVRLWDLKKSFPKHNVVNVGFGGSEVRDTTMFASRIVLNLKPKAFFFYAGDNDIASGRTPQQVCADFKELVTALHSKSPALKIHFIAVKPSPSRAKFYEKQVEANEAVKAFCRTDTRLNYIDIVTPMLLPDGKANPELFVKDNLHMNEKGYAIWTKIMEPLLP